VSGRVRLAALLLAACVLPAILAGCAPGGDRRTALETEVVGLVTGVEGSGPADVDRFSLRADDGRRLTFEIRPGQLGPTAFPPPHLREHLASGQKVRVAYVAQDGALVATDLQDAR
jgi:hypothetical protein